MKRTAAALLVVLSVGACPAGAQITAQIQAYRNEPKGDIQFTRVGLMDGNRVRTLYYNDGEVGHWPDEPSGEWPKGSGHTYLDGVAVLFATQLQLAGRIVHPLMSAYREEVSKDPVTGQLWMMEPVPGYLNTDVAASNTKPAINRDPTTWPKQWPSALGLGPEWNGYWYGYFGRGVSNADFETFFVMDDSKNAKYQHTPYAYYPIASDSGRGGLGLRLEVRGFQWSHVLAEDIIFWHYDIVNISDHDYDSCAFGFYTDVGVGGPNNTGNSGLFDRKLALAYAWDPSGMGVPGNYKTGYYGYAYLESPGNPWDGIDNDFDATKTDGTVWRNGTPFNPLMVDERRDDNIDNNENWVPFTDLNGNGKWDPGEPLNDDVGADGVGPTDPQYLGPDQGEGDGLPTHGEPDFDEKDKDESDQIGLTSVSVNILADKSANGVWPKNDEVMWKKMTGGFGDTLVQNANVSMVLASGTFPLKMGKRERFSMALAFGIDLDAVIFSKRTVQAIYNANYNFTLPPPPPIVTAVAGDKKVFLYWDTRAEGFRNRFLGFENGDPHQGYKKDFEGYCVYRSQEAEFNDVQLITDSQGNPTYWKPVAQFDIIDSIKGPDPVGINGARFWRGDDTGLQHSFVDTDVKNGVRYYYAVTSYSKGAPTQGTGGLQPTECSKVITEDYNGTLKFTDVNCAVVVPNAAAAGYTPPQILGNISRLAQGIGSGRLDVQVINPSSITEGAAYRVHFNSSGTAPKYRTVSYDVIRTVGSKTDTLLAHYPSSDIGPAKYSPPFDGMVMSFRNDTTIAVLDSLTGWMTGKSNIRMAVTPDKSNPGANVAWPADYELRWSANVVDTSFDGGGAPYPPVPVHFTITDLGTGKRVKFLVEDRDNSNTLTFGDNIKILNGPVDDPTSVISWNISWASPYTSPIMPADGDKFEIRISKPFYTDDYFAFTSKASTTDNNLAKSALGNILVVPNPYVAQASWEHKNILETGRGTRKLDFINLPAKCTIRIFTVAGALVKTLHKDSAPADGSLSWNLITEDGMDVAYGLYVFHVDAPGVGQYIGKFAVIK